MGENGTSINTTPVTGELSPWEVDALLLGSFVTVKARPAEPLAHIHSKPVNYTNNGGGRDTYISDSAGGLK